jgi:N-acetylglucosaminyldiphosphoundecaprenol N-acetyl-beta-D-mannosaminyltransferase
MSAFETNLLPRAKLMDVLGGRARLVGSRFDSQLPRGFVSPVEPRLRMGLAYDDLRTAEESYLARRSLRADLGVMARTALAVALSPGQRTTPAPRPYIVSARVDNLTVQEAQDFILAPPETSRARLVYFVHAHALNLARFNEAYRKVLAEADALLPDGIGIRLAGRVLRVAMRHNVNGTDLFPILCREAAAKGIPVAFVGGAPGIAERCAERMRQDYPELQTPVISSGYFATEADAEAVAQRIAALGRVLVLVGMGSPRQEQWSWKYLRNCAGATVLTVGGLFDFYSGRIRRAPIFWREAGMEWVWRMLQEPRRLAKRYLVGNPLFLALALEQRLRGRKP